MPIHTASTSRRRFLTGAASTLAALPLASAAAEPGQTPGDPSVAQAPSPKTGDSPKAKAAPRRLPAKGRFPIVSISSANGLEAARKGHDLMLAGKDPLDACVEGANLIEDGPNDTSVRYGSLPNAAVQAEAGA